MADVSVKPIRRLLVANRGEIARRIFRTAHRMGIGSVAIYSEGDARAPFVQEADIAIALQGRSSTASSAGTPTSLTTRLAASLSPMPRIAAGEGPTQVRPASITACAKRAFSDKKP